MKIILYIKTHNATGLKYFGKTNRIDPENYIGSGKYWKRHIKKHGYDVTTEIYGIFDNLDSCQQAALDFSIKNNIVESTQWANLQNENGLDGAPVGHKGHKFTSAQIEKMSKSSKERWANPEYKKELSNSQKASWTEERKKIQRKRLIEEFWTEERKNAHSEKLKGHIGSTKCKGIKKKDGFGLKISAALSGKPKSDEHKQKLKNPKPLVICRLVDKKEMSAANFANWCRLNPQI